jgi:Flp pilus assembly protein TadB
VVGYGLKLVAACILLLLAGVLAIVLFEGLWVRIGLGAAIVVIVGGVLFMAWRTDQKAKASRAGLERI